MKSMSVFFYIANLLIPGQKMLMLTECKECATRFIHFLDLSLGKVELCKVSSLQDMCDRL